MSLKDLTVKKSLLREEQVEEIVSEYVRYDPNTKEVFLLPGAGPLKNRQKVLIYLVALQGWPFVTDDPVPTDATPASIEQALNIPGGSLRPTLKELKDSHLILVKGRSYRVHPAALAQIKDEICPKK
jgi:hypothetical protein